MAFHVACPITCRKICFCPLGFPRRLQSEKGKNDFLQDVARVEQFLNDPWLIKARENATIQVKVPKVVVSPPPPPQLPEAPALGVGGDEESAAASAQVKRGALQKQAAVASMVAEDFARRFESGDLADTSVKNSSGEEPGLSNTKVMCRLCFSGENEGSERARKMLSCSSCGKKYHRNCLKTWSQNRDLFHWSSWTCPSCRICEVCRRIGDPNKFMFCKRCDGAYHCYCQQPPHKNIGHGPYLCPKHTKCHSCGSAVPGNGQSVRWFLGYTCCDACGRLFVKGNYCPVCLKVYRDSESTPMVCCDFCQKWVHCPCDGISDAKYMQFQVDGNLQYVCPTCRGECPQIRNIEEAVQELWRRRDEIDRDVIVSLRAAAGLPTQEEIFDISPFSDDEESGPLSKNDHGRSLKFSLKGMGDKSPRKSKKYGKKSSNKKYGKKKDIHQTGHTDGSLSGGYNTSDYKNEELGFSSEPVAFSPAGGILNEAASSKCKYMEDVSGKNETKPSRTIKIRKPQGITNKEDISTSGSIPKTAQGPKLVIHLGGRSRNTISPARPEATSFKKGQDLTSLNVGTDGVYQMKQHEHTDEPDTTTKYRVQKGVKIDHQVKDLKVREKEGHFIKLKTADSEVSNISSKLSGGEFTDGYDSVSPKKSLSLLGERGNEDVASTRGGFEVSFSWRGKHSSVKSAEDGSANSNDLIDDGPSIPYVSPVSEKDRKPYLKFKIPKNTNNGEQNAPSNLSNGKQTTLPLHGKEDITYTRGQRSKRRRPVVGDEDVSQWTEDNTMKDFTDANWILQKLGKDAAGKRVEVHQPSGNSWHRGTVVEVFEGTSVVAIALDDGKSKNFELGKQGIRFVSQKQKR